MFSHNESTTQQLHFMFCCRSNETPSDEIAEHEFSPECDLAMRELMEFLSRPVTPEELDHEHKLALTIVEQALRICGSHGLPPEAFAGRCQHTNWVLETNSWHMKECDDPDCDYWCCRLARGWTPDQIRADIAECKRRARNRRKLANN